MNARLASVLVFSLVLGLAEIAAAQLPPLGRPETVGMSSERLARIGVTLRDEIAHDRLPGAVVAIARKDRLVYYESFGYLDPGAGILMPKDAIFNIASMTKPLTAAGALALVEEGRLLLNDPVGKYLPPLDAMPVAVMSRDGATVAATEPARRKPTIQDLMRHTAGMTYGSQGTSELHKRYGALNLGELTSAAFLEGLGALPLHYHPGTTWDYGLGLDVLGLAIEAVSGQTLGRFLEERLFRPLGMVDTGFVVPAGKVGRYAKALPRNPVTGGAQAIADRTTQPSLECGGGCGVSTALDYLRFASMLLNGGTGGNRRVLGRKTVEFMTADQLGPEVDIDRLRALAQNLNGHGFGLGVAVRRTTGVAGIMGSAGDFNWAGADGTYFWVDPSERLIVVFMAAVPGEQRLRSRQLITALALQAIVD
jgi:CubicO group peptidase (beta-lactamase class C family)